VGPEGGVEVGGVVGDPHFGSHGRLLVLGGTGFVGEFEGRRGGVRALVETAVDADGAGEARGAVDGLDSRLRCVLGEGDCGKGGRNPSDDGDGDVFLHEGSLLDGGAGHGE